MVSLGIFDKNVFRETANSSSSMGIFLYISWIWVNSFADRKIVDIFSDFYDAGNRFVSEFLIDRDAVSGIGTVLENSGICLR